MVKASIKGSVQRKLRPMLLYIFRKLFQGEGRRRVGGNKLFYFFKEPVHNLHKNPFSAPCTAQLLLPTNVIILHKSASTDSNRRRKLCPRTVIVRGGTRNGLLLSAANFFHSFCLCKGLLLSADVHFADYYCPRIYILPTITLQAFYLLSTRFILLKPADNKKRKF